MVNEIYSTLNLVDFKLRKLLDKYVSYLLTVSLQSHLSHLSKHFKPDFLLLLEALLNICEPRCCQDDVQE